MRYNAEIGQTPGLKKSMSQMSQPYPWMLPKNDATHLSLEVGQKSTTLGRDRDGACLRAYPPIQKGVKCTCVMGPNPPDSRDAYHAIIKKFFTQSRDSQAPINHRRPAPYPRNRCNSSNRTIDYIPKWSLGLENKRVHCCGVEPIFLPYFNPSLLLQESCTYGTSAVFFIIIIRFRGNRFRYYYLLLVKP